MVFPLILNNIFCFVIFYKIFMIFYRGLPPYFEMYELSLFKEYRSNYT